jgi:hypothetical protein
MGYMIKRSRRPGMIHIPSSLVIQNQPRQTPAQSEKNVLVVRVRAVAASRMNAIIRSTWKG